MTRSYDFKVSKKIISPDGVNKSAIVINDAFPGQKPAAQSTSQTAGA